MRAGKEGTDDQIGRQPVQCGDHAGPVVLSAEGHAFASRRMAGQHRAIAPVPAMPPPPGAGRRDMRDDLGTRGGEGGDDRGQDAGPVREQRDAQRPAGHRGGPRQMPPAGNHRNAVSPQMRRSSAEAASAARTSRGPDESRGQSGLDGQVERVGPSRGHPPRVEQVRGRSARRGASGRCRGAAKKGRHAAGQGVRDPRGPSGAGTPANHVHHPGARLVKLVAQRRALTDGRCEENTTGRAAR